MAFFSIQGNALPTSSSIKSLFDFLTDFKNFGSILPEDKADNFSFTPNSCSFNIRGITPMTVVLKNKIPYTYIEFSSEGLGKFNFELKVEFTGSPEACGTSVIVLSGDLNPFIKAMAEKPLMALVESMNKRLSELKLSDHEN
jgi:hypothetical protein